MGKLLSVLSRRVASNAQAQVTAYVQEFPEYRKMAAKPHARTEMLDHAVWVRRRMIELVHEHRALGDEDLAQIAEIGRNHARQDFSTSVVQQALALYVRLTLREIHDAADTDDLDDLLRVTAWLGTESARGTAAFLRGYMEEQRLCLSVTRRLDSLTQLLLANDPAASPLADDLGVRIHDHYVVVAIRIPSRPFEPGDSAHEDLVENLFRRHPLPVVWLHPNELVALIPGEAGGSSDLALTGDRPLSVVRNLVAMVARPCCVGAATGQVSALAQAMEQARRVARVVPAETAPRALYGVADVFVELGVTHMPEVDQLLQDVVQRLANGPDLVTTLDAYYHNDMNRLATAAALHVHPRTLDYRLRRVRDLVAVDPSSVRGVRLLSTAVTRGLAGAW